MKIFEQFFIALILGTFSIHVYALGAKGHRVVGQIAENHLSCKASKAITEILNGQPLAFAATWPDEMRSSKENINFWSYAAAGSWHFVNIDANVTYEDSKKSEVGDAFVALNTFIAILSNTPLPNGPVKVALMNYFGDLSDPKKQHDIKQFAVKFIIHILGDMHQPLHAGHGVDLGGNKIAVTWLKNDQKYNLHKVWDSGLIEVQGLSFTEIVKKLERNDKNKINAIQQGNARDWLHEVIALREDIYDLSAYEDNKLSYDYAKKYLPVIENQMLKAGLRTAAIFNKIYQ